MGWFNRFTRKNRAPRQGSVAAATRNNKSNANSRLSSAANSILGNLGTMGNRQKRFGNTRNANNTGENTAERVKKLKNSFSAADKAKAEEAKDILMEELQPTGTIKNKLKDLQANLKKDGPVIISKDLEEPIKRILGFYLLVVSGYDKIKSIFKGLIPPSLITAPSKSDIAEITEITGAQRGGGNMTVDGNTKDILDKAIGVFVLVFYASAVMFKVFIAAVAVIAIMAVAMSGKASPESAVGSIAIGQALSRSAVIDSFDGLKLIRYAGMDNLFAPEWRFGVINKLRVKVGLTKNNISKRFKRINIRGHAIIYDPVSERIIFDGKEIVLSDKGWIREDGTLLSQPIQGTFINTILVDAVNNDTMRELHAIKANGNFPQPKARENLPPPKAPVNLPPPPVGHKGQHSISEWEKVDQDGETWYENVETGETAWNLPPGGTVVRV